MRIPSIKARPVCSRYLRLYSLRISFILGLPWLVIIHTIVSKHCPTVKRSDNPLWLSHGPPLPLRRPETYSLMRLTNDADASTTTWSGETSGPLYAAKLRFIWPSGLRVGPYAIL